MSKTDKTQTAKPTEDVIPEPHDDGGELLNAEQPSQDASDQAPAGEASQTPKPEDQPEDPRAAIARRYQENRKRANATDEADEPVAEAAPPAPVVATPAPQERDGDKEITLKIDGREVKKPMSEVIALAQQTVAGDNRLEETKRLLREAQALRGQPKDTEHQPSPGDEKTTQPDSGSEDKSQVEHKPRRDLNPEKLKGIVERIQVGDTDEGTQALQELIEVVRDSGESFNPAKVGELVQQHLIRTQTQEEINTALAGFVKDYPDLAKDEVLADAGRTVLRQELIKDLKSVGASDAEIDKIKHDPRALAAAQRELRVAGHSVRSYADILGAVGKTMVDRFNIKPATSQISDTHKPQTVREPAPSQERLDRKRAAPQQPRTAGVRSQIAQAPQPKTKKDVVADMRKARGFSNLS